MTATLNGTTGLTLPDGSAIYTASSLGARNVLYNPGFTINQRVYASAGTLASGSLGHDRWKAGASGGNYSFTQLNSNTQITIAASKSIIQVVENVNVIGGTYVLSWTGTATARYAINSATPTGNFAVSPITVTGQTAGTTMSVEFTGANAVGTSLVASNTGTLSVPQLELGLYPTPIENRPFGIELFLCLRYYEKSYPLTVLPGTVSTRTGAKWGFAFATTQLTCGVTFQAAKVTTSPTIVLYSYNGTSGVWTTSGDADTAAASAADISNTGFWRVSTTGLTGGNAYYGNYTAESEL